jgi:molybdopterin synthase sulfur carrier subunit
MTTVLFFGRTADKLGRSREVALGNGWTVSDLRRHLSEADPDAADALARPDVRASLDKLIVSDDVAVRADQEIAFFSVFSGG